MRQTAIRFGLYSGLIVSIFFLGPFLFMDIDSINFESGEIVGYGTMLLAMIFVPVGIASYRKKEGNGSISFMPALKVGLMITLVSTVVFYLANVLFYEVLAPSFLSDFMAVYPEKMIALAETEAERQEIQQELDQYAANIDMWTNGWIYGMFMAGSTMMMGLVFTLLTALVFSITDRGKVVA